jgi:hypothetical protein
MKTAVFKCAAMTEEDYQQTYQELATMLKDMQLGWVVKQVEILVRSEGATASLDNRPGITRADSPQALLTKSAPYTAQEQLLLLIDATERLVVDSTEIEGDLVQFLESEEQRLQQPVTIEFASDDFKADKSKTPFRREGITERCQAAAALRQLLQKLRQEATVGVD